ncbi:transducin beta-like protein 2 isoform X3 [Panulirus ornatus]|uniref:transducin beta-like protein 2 isoform X3 n=1 Tax=Panulirus ornatus TaxID=150431 RepID=UPI003A8C4654
MNGRRYWGPPPHPVLHSEPRPYVPPQPVLHVGPRPYVPPHLVLHVGLRSCFPPHPVLHVGPRPYVPPHPVLHVGPRPYVPPHPVLHVGLRPYVPPHPVLHMGPRPYVPPHPVLHVGPRPYVPPHPVLHVGPRPYVPPHPVLHVGRRPCFPPHRVLHTGLVWPYVYPPADELLGRLQYPPRCDIQLSIIVMETRSQKKQSAEPVSSKNVGNKASKKKPLQKPKPGNIAPFTHPELMTSLKGHTGSITSGGFSSNGKHFISAADDRTVLIWSAKDFNQREHKSVRGNIEYDHATKVCWSPDGKAFIIHKSVANTMEVYKVSKRDDGTLGKPQVALTFPQHSDVADIISMDVAVSGKFIMTCNDKNQLIIWSLRGEIMEAIDTRHGDTYSATLSPCGRFIATTGFTPDVKVWEVKFGKTGNFEGMKRAYDLTGHTAGIYSCGINCDSTRMVSLSKDGTWKLYDTNIEFEKGQLVYLLLTSKYDCKEQPSKIKLSPDGRTAVIAFRTTLMFFSAITGEKLNTISDIYSGNIVDLFFDPSNKLVLTLGDRHVRVFHNVAGYMATIQDLQQNLRQATNSTMRERLDQQIKDAKKALQNIKKVIRKTK